MHDLELDFFDLRRLWSEASASIGFYLNWLGSDYEECELRFGIGINRVSRTVALLDLGLWASYVADFGFPTVDIDTIRFPADGDRPFALTNTTEHPAWRTVCEHLGLAFGFPPEYYAEMIEATRLRPLLT